MSFAYIFDNYESILFQHQYTLLPNMSKKSAALEAKFEIAVKTILKAACGRWWGVGGSALAGDVGASVVAC